MFKFQPLPYFQLHLIEELISQSFELNCPMSMCEIVELVAGPLRAVTICGDQYLLGRLDVQIICGHMKPQSMISTFFS